MTLFDVDRLFAYWREQPPTHELAAMYLRSVGWKPTARRGDRMEQHAPKPEERINTPEALAEFLPFFDVG